MVYFHTSLKKSIHGIPLTLLLPLGASEVREGKKEDIATEEIKTPRICSMGKEEMRALIVSFADQAKVCVQAIENETIEELNEQYKDATDATQNILEKLRGAQELTEDLKDDGMDVLNEHNASQYETSSGEFVLKVVEKCISEGIDHSSYVSFFSSLSQEESVKVANDTKDFILTYGIKKFKYLIILQQNIGNNDINYVMIIDNPKEKSEPFDEDEIKTPEQLATLLSKSLDTLRGVLDRSVKEIKAVSARGQKQIADLVKILLGDSQREKGV